MNLNCSKNCMVATFCLASVLGYSPRLSAAPGGSALPLPNEVQQTKKITGTVSDAMGPVIGASIKVKGTNTGVVTDFDGKFSLQASPGQTLVITYVGYLPKEVKITSQSDYAITIVEDRQMLNEVVVVGYGTMKKSDVAGATGSMDEKKMKGSIITNLDQAFAGRVAG